MFFKQLATKESSLSYFSAALDWAKPSRSMWWLATRSGSCRRPVRPMSKSHVIDTHVHADHYSGGRSLAQKVQAPYCLHESNHGQVHYDFLPLQDGQLLDVGNVKVKALHTPGHTPDTLFVGAVGRPDLPGQEQQMAGVLYDTFQTKLLSLPHEIEIYPGHQAGSACGAGSSGKPSSTLGFEKRWNPALAMERGAFISFLTQEIPPPSGRHGRDGAFQPRVGELNDEHGHRPPGTA